MKIENLIIKKFGSPIIYLFILALLLRLYLSFFQYSGDVHNHLVWGNGFLAQPFGFYDRHFPGFNDPNYPPLTIVFFAISNLLFSGINNLFSLLNNSFRLFPSLLLPLFLSQNMQMAFLKLPAILADLGVGFLLYRIFSKRKERHTTLLVSLYLFNPAVLYISSVWGQIESITIFFLLFSLFQAIYGKRNRGYSIFIFVLAVLTKQTALWFLPLFLPLWYKEIRFGELLKGTLFGLVGFFTAYIPFGLNPLSAISSYFSTLSGSSNVVADSAWNVWSFFYPSGTLDSEKLGIFSIRQISVFLLFLLLVSIIYRLFTKYSQDYFFNYLFLWSVAVFFLQTRVHERHLAFSLVFLLITPGLISRYLLDIILLTIFHFSNLYSTLKLPFIE